MEAVNRRFPDASKTSVGGFVFLRLFNPTILTPETSGFSKQAIPVSKNVKKLLLQATRMMQNLANNMMFGAKEPHLISLNDFITSNLYKVANFLREISKPPTTLEHDKAGNNKVRMDTIAYTNLHRYMTENLDKISRDLSARRGRSNEDNQKMLEYKRTMDRFSNILAQLGPPSEVAQQELATTRNYAFVNGNKFYSDFMRRNKHRDIGPMSALNIFYQSGVSRANHPVFYFIMRHIKSESFDFELLIYYMLRVSKY